MKDNCLHTLVRLRIADVPLTKIAESIGLAKSTTQKRLTALQHLYPNLSDALDVPEVDLESLILKPRRQQQGFHEPNWEFVYECYRRRGRQHRSLQMLWEDYCNNIPEGVKPLSYKSFCKNFQLFCKNLPAAYEEMEMTNQWTPGDVVQIDYSGDRLFYTDAASGKTIPVEIFVATLAYSNYTFVWATPGQTRDDWLDAQIEMFKFFKAVPRHVILDNAKPLVNQTDRYNPRICRDYVRFCDHYGTVPVATRPGQPRDKGLIEGHVGIVQRRVLNPLLGAQFFSIDEINKRLMKDIQAFNQRLLTTHVETTRQMLFEEERPTMLPLPPVPFERSCVTKILSVSRRYTVRFDNKRYSVPAAYVGKKVKASFYPREGILRIFDPVTGERITEFYPSDKKPTQIRLEHMPPAHQAMVMTKEQLVQLLSEPGKQSAKLVEVVCAHNYGMKGLKLLRGLNSLRKSLGQELFEDCAKATMNRPNPSYEAFLEVANLMASGHKASPSCTHGQQGKGGENVRGSDYYETEDEQ